MSDTPLDSTWWLASDGKWYPPQSKLDSPPPPPSVTDRPTDPTWWLASDGKWYPPQSRVPQFQAPLISSPPGASPDGYVPTGLTGSLQFLLALSAFVTGVLIVLSLASMDKFNVFMDAPAGSRREEMALAQSISADENLNTMIGLASVLATVVFVLIVIWSYRAHKVTRQPRTGHRSWTLGWSIGSWFIPFANIVIPKLVLTETEKIALSNRDGREHSRDWQNEPSSPIGWVWWIAYIVGGGLFLIGSAMFDDADGTIDSWRTGYWLVAAGSTALLVSCISGALYVGTLGRALAPKRSS